MKESTGTGRDGLHRRPERGAPAGASALFKATVEQWKRDKPARLAAALAYYAVFSLPPLLLVLLGVASIFLERDVVQAQFLAQVSRLTGEEGAGMVRTMLEGGGINARAGTLATVIGAVTLLLGATGAVLQLVDALNIVWNVVPVPGGGVTGLVRKRAISVVLVGALAFMLLVSLVVSAGIAAFGDYIARMAPGIAPFAWLANVAVSLGIVTLFFAVIFKFLPAVRLGWRDVWVGALATAVLFLVGEFALGFYLGRAGVASAYGAAGSLVLILLWLYYSAQILFLGAEFTQAYALRTGRRIVPAEGAAWAAGLDPDGRFEAEELARSEHKAQLPLPLEEPPDEGEVRDRARAA